MKPSKSYQESLIKALKEPKEAAEYINAAFAENDSESLLLALRNVAEAHGLSKVSRQTKLNRVSLYRMLSRKGNPELHSIITLLNSWGLKLSVTTHQHLARRAA